MVTSVAMCLMRQNCRTVAEMIELCGSLGVSLRVNLYKPVNSFEFMPGYTDLWDAVEAMFASGCVSSCSEPILNAALGECGFEASGEGSPCATASFRVRPTGEIMPCVYWGHTGVFVRQVLSGEKALEEALEPLRSAPLPEDCADCPHVELCRGGCLGRRLYTGIAGRDCYCFVGREDPPRLTTGVRKSDTEWVHAGYLCTVIMDPTS